MADKLDVAQTEKLKKFISETSADEISAKYYLESEGWDLETAIAGFKHLKLAEEKRSESRSSGAGGSNDRPNPGKKNDRVAPLRRGLSMANSELVANAREEIKTTVKSESCDRSDLTGISPTYSFVLPNINVVKDKDLVAILKQDLIDKATYCSLTKAGVLNWWAEESVSCCRKIFPMSTVGDGNCLLHAVSLAMWGFHDRLLTLRKSLYQSLTNDSAKGALRRRWMYQQWKLNMDAGGLTFTPDEWDDEWKGIVRLASDKPRGKNGATATPRKISKQYSIATSPSHDDSLKRSDSHGSDSFESLEEFHVFALAQVLRRPIVVVSDTMLRDIEGQPLQPIHFGGIYLPIECNPARCYKYPLVLGYDSGHFAALVPAEGEDVNAKNMSLSSSIPLTRQNLELLPVHFITDPGEVWQLTADDSKKKKLPQISKEETLSILSKYLHVVKVSQTRPTFQNDTIDELVLDASDLGSFYGKKTKDGKQFISKAIENISTLVSVQTNLMKKSPKLQRKTSGKQLYAAKLDIANLPKYFDDMIKNYISSMKQRLEGNRGSRATIPIRKQCTADGCTFFGSPETSYLCSKCYRHQQELSKVHKSMPVLKEEMSLLKQAERKFSNPEAFGTSGEDLLKFHDRTYSDPFRPATAPPSNFNFRENSVSRGKSFDSFIDDGIGPVPGHMTKVTSTSSGAFDVIRKEPGDIYPERLPPYEPRLQDEPSAMSSAYSDRSSEVLITIPEKDLNKGKQRDVTTRSFYRRELVDFDPILNDSTRKAMDQFHEVGVTGFERLCRNIGCKIFGTPELDGYCYSCFARRPQKTGYV